MLLWEAYETLELTEGASRTEIRQAYARLSKIYHVETHPAEFSRLHEAYKTALAAAGKAGAEEQKSPDISEFSDFSDRQDTSTHSSTESSSENSPGTGTASDHILDRLLGTNFSIQNCSELAQLLYYRCRYDEISPEIDAKLLRITNAEQGISDEAYLQTAYETIACLPDDRTFLGTAWRIWKKLGFACIVCHPVFYQMQYTPAFLDELCHFLLEETLNLRDGIRQELYFALCMSYGFFSETEDTAKKDAGNALLAEIEKLLFLHPKHQEYIKDLELWPDCQQERRIVQFCQKAYHALDPKEHSAFTALKIPEAAAELLLDEEISWKEFIYDRLAGFSSGSLYGQFIKKRKEFRHLCQLRQEFTHDFIHLLDNHVNENYIYDDCYVPLAIRLGRIKDRYLAKKEWKKIICRPVFFQAFQNWLLPRHNGFFSVPCIMHYDTWKMLRTCFEGSSPFEENCIRYLTQEFYFPEYEKRYQRELVWENAHIEEAYFKETFPVPALNEGKKDLLRTIKNASAADIKELEKIFGNLTFDAAGLDFLTRITNAMTRFNFLLVTQKREKDAVPGDAFCFLTDEVLLYRKKENLLCRLTHPVFYDLISWKFEAAAFHALDGREGYDEKFLDTACKNLYLYRCYAVQGKGNCPSPENRE